MVRRIGIRALVIAPFAVVALWVWGGPVWALSCALGFVMTLANLWLAARIIGAFAQRSPQLLVAAAMAAFALGLAVLTAIAFALQKLDFVYFPVTGFTLIAAHLGLVLWEAARGAYQNAPVDASQALPTKELRGWN